MTVSDHPVFITARIPARTHSDMCELMRRLDVKQDALVEAALECYLTAEFLKARVEVET